MNKQTKTEKSHVDVAKGGRPKNGHFRGHCPLNSDPPPALSAQLESVLRLWVTIQKNNGTAIKKITYLFGGFIRHAKY